MVGLAAAADVQVAPDVSARNKINLSGRQRMLTQMMAKAACFVHMDVHAASHAAAAREAHALFDKTLRALAQGDPSLGMLQETDRRILATLGRVDMLWASYGPMIAAVAEGASVLAEDMAHIARANMPTLRTMNEAVTLFEERYGDKDVAADLAKAINMAGRQRMLTQKASKEFCLIAAGHQVQENRAALRDSIALFTSSLDTLRKGDPQIGVAAPTTQEMVWQYERVNTQWQAFRVILAIAADGGVVTSEDLDRIAQINVNVLREADTAVWLYNQ